MIRKCMAEQVPHDCEKCPLITKEDLAIAEHAVFHLNPETFQKPGGGGRGRGGGGSWAEEDSDVCLEDMSPPNATRANTDQEELTAPLMAKQVLT